jgi:hypothetical protein
LGFPKALQATHLAGLRDVLRQAPADQRQPLLDELEGQLRIPGKTIHNPAGWVLSVIRQRQRGPLVLPLADQVAQERVHRLAVEERVRQATSGHPVQQEARAPSPRADPAVIQASRERLAQLRSEILSKGVKR